MSCYPHYCSETAPKEHQTNPDWMSKIPNKLVSEMTIPGTHDTCARVSVFGFIQTQTWPLAEQLKAGIRYVDIRCMHYENRFEVHHDMFYCGVSFDNVLSIIKDFLTNYPSEGFIMRIREDFKAMFCTRSFEETFIDYLNKNKDLVYLAQGVPYLDDIRGKIWILINFDSSIKCFKYGDAIIQDCWWIDSISAIDIKCDLIREWFRKAISGKRDDLYLNFCSAVGYTTWPFMIANHTNKVPFEFKGRLGIVCIDFPGEQLIKHLIEQNYHDEVEEDDWVVVQKY
jgi:1-phosphatidylinositol phosphodiesterase